ncbi:MAG: hypothetical protein ISS20_17640, partial [Acidovorax sp.]|nr:hypothetical protein [Acidovorax sp.]
PVYVGGTQDTLVANSGVGEVVADLGARVGADVVGADVNMAATTTASVGGSSLRYVSLSYMQGGSVQSTVMTVDGNKVYYQSTSDGTIKAVYEDCGEIKTAFTVEGVVNADGTTSYVTNMMAVADKVQVGTTQEQKQVEKTIRFGDSASDDVSYKDGNSTKVAEDGWQKNVTYTDSTSGYYVKVSAARDEVVQNSVIPVYKSNGQLDGWKVSVEDSSITPDGSSSNDDAKVKFWSVDGNASNGGGFGVGEGDTHYLIDNDDLDLSKKYGKNDKDDAEDAGDGAGERLVVELFDANGTRLTADKVEFQLNNLLKTETAAIRSVVTSGSGASVTGSEQVSGTNTNTSNDNLGDGKSPTADGTPVAVTLENVNTAYFEAKPGTDFSLDDKITITHTMTETVTKPVYADQVWIDFQAVIVDGDGDKLAKPIDVKVVIDTDTKLDGDKVVLSDAVNGGLAVKGGDASETIVGSAGHDTVLAGKGDDVVKGGDGDDKLDGQAGNDTLDGGKGIDTLVGGKGSDTLTGGDDDDTIKINLADSTPGGADKDVVKDLIEGDKIEVADLLADDGGDLLASLPPAADAAGDTTVTLDSNGSAGGGASQTVVVEDTTPAALAVDLALGAPSVATIEVKPNDD